MFRLPVVVPPKQRQQCFAGATPPPPSTCNKYFPSGLSPRWTQSNKQYGFFYWKPECLLERANDLIVDCVSMSECLTKLPTRVECRREWGGRGVVAEKERRGVKKKKEKTKLLTSRWEGNKMSARFWDTGIDKLGFWGRSVITELLLLLEYIISQRLLQPWLNKSVVIPLVSPGGFARAYLTRLIKTLPCLAFPQIYMPASVCEVAEAPLVGCIFFSLSPPSVRAHTVHSTKKMCGGAEEQCENLPGNVRRNCPCVI